MPYSRYGPWLTLTVAPPLLAAIALLVLRRRVTWAVVAIAVIGRDG